MDDEAVQVAVDEAHTLELRRVREGSEMEVDGAAAPSALQSFTDVGAVALQQAARKGEAGLVAVVGELRSIARSLSSKGD